MASLVLQFVLLALAVILAGTFLATSADRIAHFTGLGRSLTGFLLLAAATSLPELTIDCNAAALGAVDIALGDLLGSSLFNLLILGTIDLVQRSDSRILSPVSAAHALSASTSSVLTGLVLIGLLVPWEFELFGIGIVPLMIFVTYLLSVRLIFFDQRISQLASCDVDATEAKVPGTLQSSVFTFASAALVVFVCSPRLASVADALAEQSGLGGTLVGTILVALTTSLPEIITTLAAVRLGAFELAAGNIFGSNCFNVAILPAVDFFYEPGALLNAADQTHAFTAAAVVVITGLAVMGLLYRVEKRYWIVEPDALLVVLLSLGSLLLVMFMNV